MNLSVLKITCHFVTLMGVAKREQCDKEGILGRWPGYVKLFVEVVIDRKSNRIKLWVALLG